MSGVSSGRMDERKPRAPCGGRGGSIRWDQQNDMEVGWVAIAVSAQQQHIHPRHVDLGDASQ